MNQVLKRRKNLDRWEGLSPWAVNTDMVSRFGCDECSTSLCRGIAEGEPELQTVLEMEGEFGHNILLNREPLGRKVTCCWQCSRNFDPLGVSKVKCSGKIAEEGTSSLSTYS